MPPVDPGPFPTLRFKGTKREKEYLRLLREQSSSGQLFDDLDFSGSQHNDIESIQGGTDGQYYHLTSAEYSGLIPKLDTNLTEVGNVGTGEDDLISYILAGSTLAEIGNGIRITALVK